jgi:thiamine kinase-like enzyme
MTAPSPATGATDALAARLGPHVAARVRDALHGSAGQTRRALPLHVESLTRKPGRALYRVRMGTDRHASSIIIKQHGLDAARRNRRVAERWLPALGLQEAGPALLGSVADAAAERIWLIYEDVPGRSLESTRSADGDALAAVELIARLHTRAADHHLLPEIRREGEDLGMDYFTANVGDALRLLEALLPPAARPTAAQVRVRDRLQRRLESLLSDAPNRATLMADVGAADTLLHGDLWTSNILVHRDGDGPRARLVDWDHAGAGPIYYDLSAFLYRFPTAARPALLARYGELVARSGWTLPPAPVANLLFETAECARYANRIIWPAIALLEENAAWAWVELVEIDGWFRALEPVLQE